MGSGGPDGELGASLRYLSQRYTMPVKELKATLTDIGVEELNHLEMIGTIVYQLTKGLSTEEILRVWVLRSLKLFLNTVKTGGVQHLPEFSATSLQWGDCVACVS